MRRTDYAYVCDQSEENEKIFYLNSFNQTDRMRLTGYQLLNDFKTKQYYTFTEEHSLKIFSEEFIWINLCYLFRWKHIEVKPESKYEGILYNKPYPRYY